VIGVLQLNVQTVRLYAQDVTSALAEFAKHCLEVIDILEEDRKKLQKRLFIEEYTSDIAWKDKIDAVLLEIKCEENATQSNVLKSVEQAIRDADPNHLETPLKFIRAYKTTVFTSSGEIY